MSYSGQTYRVRCDAGGLDYNQNIDLIEPYQMFDGSQNINLHLGGRSKRGGTTHVDATAMNGSYSSTWVQSWLTQEAGFNYNDTSGYTYNVRMGDASGSVASTGSIAFANLRLSTEAGNAFVDFGAGTLTLGCYFELIDSAGKKIGGYIGAAGTAETYGTNKSLTGITKANPGIVTFTAGHALTTLSCGKFFSLTEMTSLNNKCRVIVSTGTNTFSIGDASGETAAETTGGACFKQVLTPSSTGVTIGYGVPKITMLYYWMMQDGSTSFVLRATSDGKIYKDKDTAIALNMGNDLTPRCEVMDNTLFIAVPGVKPKTWDGSAATVTDMTDIPSSWTGAVFPKQFVKHGYLASERMWAFGFADGSFYASKDGVGTDFNDADVITMKINTGDGWGIVAGFEYGDRLFAVGKRSTYYVDDSDTDSSKWGYQKAQFEGGASHDRLICVTPNDVVMMMENGEVYSFTGALQYGDYQLASLTRPAHIDHWIQENCDLSYIDKFHMVYDPILRAVRIWVVRKGMTTPDSCLLYFVDRKPAEAWSIHNSIDLAGAISLSGYYALCSALVRVSEGVFKIYTGDSLGCVWELESTTLSDNGLAYWGVMKTPHLTIDDPRQLKMFNAMRVVLEREAGSHFWLKWYVDAIYQGQHEFTMNPGGASMDTFLLDTNILGEATIQDVSIPLGAIGKRIQFEIYDGDVGGSFLISQLMIDVKMMGSDETI